LNHLLVVPHNTEQLTQKTKQTVRVGNLILKRKQKQTETSHGTIRTNAVRRIHIHRDHTNGIWILLFLILYMWSNITMQRKQIYFQQRTLSEDGNLYRTLPPTIEAPTSMWEYIHSR